MKHVLVLLLTLAACSRDDRGLSNATRAFEESRFTDALAGFTAAIANSDGAASAELLANQALAAVATGDERTARIALERAAARGGAAFEPFREFLLGNLAFLRAELAAKQARGPEAEPAAFDVAIGHAKDAIGGWERALELRAEPWPEAGRNIARAQRRIDGLIEEREAAAAARKNKKDGGKKPRRSLPAPELVDQLLDKLAARDRRKIEQRRARQGAQRATVERDW